MMTDKFPRRPLLLVLMLFSLAGTTFAQTAQQPKKKAAPPAKAAFAPAENLIAVTDAPPTIDAAMEAAYHLSGTYFPFDDLIVADPYKDMAEGLKLAYYIGQSHVVGDTTTDMVAYVDNGAFIEIWIGVEDKLPRLVHAVYLNDPAQLRHNLLLSNWQLDLAVPADAFAPANASGAKHIPFAHPHPPQGAKPSAQAKPSKAQQ